MAADKFRYKYYLLAVSQMTTSSYFRMTNILFSIAIANWANFLVLIWDKLVINPVILTPPETHLKL